MAPGTVHGSSGEWSGAVRAWIEGWGWAEMGGRLDLDLVEGVRVVRGSSYIRNQGLSMSMSAGLTPPSFLPPFPCSLHCSPLPSTNRLPLHPRPHPRLTLTLTLTLALALTLTLTIRPSHIPSSPRPHPYTHPSTHPPSTLQPASRWTVLPQTSAELERGHWMLL
ncbi:unnamed protein product [Cyclocybe aegerita]|uniref:Uncharacterized protein n=1 Tax=Cyclocybe aegerita TaxID=1973307 RepID=A0A8S0XTN6_CYCAE|nr:unnamed protein product [Cyclocybe aegerita]